MNDSIIPIILEPTPRGERAFDLFSRLLADRIVFIDGPIERNMSSIIVAQLLYLESQDENADIYLYINSGGGSVTAGFSILDVMRNIKPDICTVGLGQCASMAGVLLTSGTKGKRAAYKHCEIMLHQVKSGNYGQASDIMIHAERVKNMNHELLQNLADNCDKPFNVIERDADRDFFLTAKDAVTYGAIDYVISNRR